MMKLGERNIAKYTMKKLKRKRVHFKEKTRFGRSLGMRSERKQPDKREEKYIK